LWYVFDTVIDASYERSGQASSNSRLKINSASSKPVISVSLNDARAKSAKIKHDQDEITSPLMEKASVTNETQVQYR